MKWMDSSFARWEVEGEAQQRISGALREAQQRRLARLARGAGPRPRQGSGLTSAHTGLQRLAGRAQAGFTAMRSLLERTPKPQQEWS
jgi:hypothetical protein